MKDATDLAKAVRSNTIVLAACMALSWAVVQLVVALSAVILSHLIGQTAFGGFAPSLFLLSWAAASLLMGRFMDARGRAMGLRIGFAIGTVGAMLVYLGTKSESFPVFLLGLILVGSCAGTINLARAGAADMYPPARRARGISFVLLGAAFGAIISPIAFTPLLAAIRSGSGGLASPWPVAAALLGTGFIVTFGIRIDPINISRRLASGGQTVNDPREQPSRPFRKLIRLPSVLPALAAAVVAQGVMTGLMSITGLIMVGHGHELSAVALVMSAHFLGMFGLVLVAGQVVDRLGCRRSIVLGLLILACGVLLLMASPGLGTVLLALFTIGLGWNFAFVGSTAVLADAAQPLERARLLGFNDFAAINMGALGAALCGVILGMVGLVPLVLVGAFLSLLPIAGMLPRRVREAHPTL